MFIRMCEMFEGMMSGAGMLEEPCLSALWFGMGRPEIEVKTKAKVKDIVNLRQPSSASVIHVCLLGHPQSNTKQRLFKVVLRFTLHV